jgi:hypothetical protein
VDGKRRLLTLCLSENPKEVEKPETVELVFGGLVDYFLEHDLGVNIVLSIEELSLDSFMAANLNQFIDHAKWGWPRFWKGNSEQSRTSLAENRCRVWELDTSYGLCGWVIAAQVDEHASVA